MQERPEAEKGGGERRGPPLVRNLGLDKENLPTNAQELGAQKDREAPEAANFHKGTQSVRPRWLIRWLMHRTCLEAHVLVTPCEVVSCDLGADPPTPFRIFGYKVSPNKHSGHAESRTRARSGSSKSEEDGTFQDAQEGAHFNECGDTMDSAMRKRPKTSVRKGNGA